MYILTAAMAKRFWITGQMHPIVLTVMGHTKPSRSSTTLRQLTGRQFLSFAGDATKKAGKLT